MRQLKLLRTARKTTKNFEINFIVIIKRILFIKIRTNGEAKSAVNNYSGFVTTLTSRATSTDDGQPM